MVDKKWHYYKSMWLFLKTVFILFVRSLHNYKTLEGISLCFSLSCSPIFYLILPGIANIVLTLTHINSWNTLFENYIYILHITHIKISYQLHFPGIEQKQKAPIIYLSMFTWWALTFLIDTNISRVISIAFNYYLKQQNT